MAHVVDVGDRELLNKDLSRLNKSVIIDILISGQIPKDVTDQVKKFFSELFRCELPAGQSNDAVHSPRVENDSGLDKSVIISHERCSEKIKYYSNESALLRTLNVSLEKRIFDLETIISLLNGGFRGNKVDQQVQKNRRFQSVYSDNARNKDSDGSDGSERDGFKKTVKVKTVSDRAARTGHGSVLEGETGDRVQQRIETDIDPTYDATAVAVSQCQASPATYRDAWYRGPTAATNGSEPNLNRGSLNATATTNMKMKSYVKKSEGSNGGGDSRRKAPVNVGRKAATADATLKSVPRESYIHVFRLDPAEIVDNVRAYVETEIGVKVAACEKLATRKAEMYSSFKITVRQADEDSMLDPSNWPEGVHIRKFFQRRNVQKSEG